MSHYSYENNSHDDLYEGFNYSIDLGPPQTSSKPQSGYNNPPGSSYHAPPSQSGRQNLSSRIGTASQGSEARPMTSVSGAGFSSKPNTSGVSRGFDPFGESKKGPAPALVEKKENSLEDKALSMEVQVHELIEKSAEENVKENYAEALDLAKDAGRKERQLSKFRTANNIDNNQELTYGVLFNLANAYQSNDMANEALNSYTLIVKNKNFSQGGRLRVNMGNIYYKQNKYPSAIKMYRMALDQIPSSSKEIRFKIIGNIGNAFVRLGQYQDAIQSYEEIVDSGDENFQTTFNLFICYFALGDAEKMRKGFATLANIPIVGKNPDNEDYDGNDENAVIDDKDIVADDATSDELKIEIRKRQKRSRYYLLTAARLCAPILDRKDWCLGYDWVIEKLNPNHPKLAGEIEICKAVHYLKEKKFEKAIKIFKSFEKKEKSLKSMAAVNLSFLYFVENDIEQSDQYANMAVKYQRYNAKALVNKGNCLFRKNDMDRAKELYLEAIGVEADCTEAIYNLGLVNKRIGAFNESLQAFEKLHTIIPKNTEVIYQIANLFDLLNNNQQATKWFNILITCFGSSSNIADPGVLSRLGQIFNKDDDETQAFHYHLESYRYFPVNLDVISWLGVWYVKSELYEKSIEFFERASQIQPNEVKWKLMVTSCYRRMGSYQKALQLYEQIHADYPENLECLRYLVAICKDLGKPYDKYQSQLAKLEKINLSRTQQQTFAVGESTRFDGSPNNNHNMNNVDDNNNDYRSPEYTSMDNDENEIAKTESYEIRNSPPKLSSYGDKSSPIKSKFSDVQDQVDDWDDADVGDLLAD